MTERERLLRKLEKVKALVDRGVGGERENAERMLADLMAQYGVTEEALEDSKASTHWIRYKTNWERKLLFQLAYMYLGPGHAFGCIGSYSGRKRKEVGIDCTPSQYIEIEADFAFYSAAMEEEMGIFYSAFINKNNLFPPPELAGESDDDDVEVDKARVMKVGAMMEGMELRTRHKSLGSAGTSDEM